MGVVDYFPVLFGHLVIVSSFLALAERFPRLSSFPLGYFPVLFRFCGSSPVPAWSSCLVFCFLSDPGFLCWGFLFRVWFPCGLSFSVCSLICCGYMRQASAPFSPRSGLFWCLLVGALVVFHLLSSSIESSFWFCRYCWCPSLILVSLSR